MTEETYQSIQLADQTAPYRSSISPPSRMPRTPAREARVSYEDKPLVTHFGHNHDAQTFCRFSDFKNPALSSNDPQNKNSVTRRIMMQFSIIHPTRAGMTSNHGQHPDLPSRAPLLAAAADAYPYRHFAQTGPYTTMPCAVGWCAEELQMTRYGAGTHGTP